MFLAKIFLKLLVFYIFILIIINKKNVSFTLLGWLGSFLVIIYDDGRKIARLLGPIPSPYAAPHYSPPSPEKNPGS